MKKWCKWAAALVLVLGVAASAIAADFTQSDLEKIVRELESVLPADKELEYPIKCSVVDKKDVNAYATATKEGDKYRATMVVYTGLVDFAKGDLKMIRAVVAHEVSHLSRGHITGASPAARDLSNLWTRQQEFDADITGASALQRLGYSKDDMVQMLLMLDGLNERKGSWWEHLSADHADPKARAAEISSNPTVLRSLMSFDAGLAFMENRKWAVAARFFDEAYAREPKLVEALVNRAQCDLMRYYELLPFAVREEWLRPDFGSMLTRTPLGPRGDGVSDEDRARYVAAVARITDAVDKSGLPRAKELLAIAQVLEPDAKKDIVQKGIDAFKALLAEASSDPERLRFANNMAVGFDRIGELNAGYDAMIGAQRKTNSFNFPLAENLGRLNVASRSKEDEQLAMNVTYTWLKYSQSLAPNFEMVKKHYLASCEKLSLKPVEIEVRPVMFAKAVAMYIGSNEYGLLRPTQEFVDGLGAPDVTLSFSERYPDLTEMRWKGGNVSIYTERGQAMRLTSYESGSSLVLRPTDVWVSGGFRVSVGMTDADLKKFLDPASGEKVGLAKGGAVEEWLYWPSLNLGLLIEDGKVKAVTVTPTE